MGQTPDSASSRQIDFCVFSGVFRFESFEKLCFATMKADKLFLCSSDIMFPFDHIFMLPPSVELKASLFCP